MSDLRNAELEKGFNDWWAVFQLVNKGQITLTEDPDDLISVTIRSAFLAGGDLVADKIRESLRITQVMLYTKNQER